MNHEELPSYDWEILFAKTLIWVGLACLGLLAALTGTFHAWIFGAYMLIAVAVVLRFALKRKLLTTISTELWIVSAVLLLAAIVFSLHTTPTIFSGRDQGTLSEAAIRLAQNHQLEFSTPASEAFFKIYGPGKALNFPGFYYTDSGQLTPQFPLAYISWLAIFYAFFGLAGFTVANAVLLALFLFNFYFLARHFLSRNYSFIALLFVLTAFSFMWFSKFTLSENMALALLWIMVAALVRFIEKQKNLAYLTLMASGIMLVFTRIEGIAFFAMALLILFFHGRTRQYLKKNSLRLLALPLAALALLFLFSLEKNVYFYKELAKALLSTWNIQSNDAGLLSTPDSLPVFYTIQLFYVYGILGFVVLGFFGAADSFIKKRFKLLTAFFVVLPSMIYLVDSHISSDQPWMLRRYIFSILPAGIFYTTVLLSGWMTRLEKFGRRLKLIPPLCVAIILVLFNLPAFAKYFAVSENDQLLEQTRQLSQNFSARDLVLVDRLATGDGWSMLTGPMSFLYNINAAYFFNTNDLAKLDLGGFENVYLITPNVHHDLYGSGSISQRLIPAWEYSITRSALDITPVKNAFFISLPNEQTTTTTGTIFEVSK